MKFEWQDIYKTEPNRHLRVATWRAKVIGGWIVQTNVSVDLNIATSSIRRKIHRSTMKFNQFPNRQNLIIC